MKKIKNMYFVWGIIVVGIFTLLTLFGLTYKNKTNEYKVLEKKLVEAEKKYVDAKFLYPNDNKELKISAEELTRNGYMDTLELNGSTCEGYATIKKNGTVFEYNGYINCGEYKTKGYE